MFDFERSWIRNLDELQREMERYVQHMSQRKPRSVVFSPRAWQPAADVYETKDEVIALVDLSGVSEEEIELVVERDSLTVRGERKGLGEVTERRYCVLEIPFGPFERTLRLPTAVDPNGASASYRSGFLVVVMPKPVPTTIRRVAVTEQ